MLLLGYGIDMRYIPVLLYDIEIILFRIFISIRFASVREPISELMELKRNVQEISKKHRPFVDEI